MIIIVVRYFKHLFNFHIEMTLQCSASLTSAEEEVAAWLNVCHSALLSTIFCAVDKAEEPQGRATLISAEADAWVSLTKNFIFSIPANVLYHSQKVGAYGTTSESDCKEELCSGGQSLETPSEEEELCEMRDNEKNVVEVGNPRNKLNIEKIMKNSTSICDSAAIPSEFFGESKKSASPVLEALISDSQKGGQIGFPSLGRERESSDRELEKGQEPSPRFTESLLCPDEFVSDLVDRKNRERSELPIGNQPSITSFAEPSLSGGRAASQNFTGWEDSSMFTDEEKLIITKNDLENNRELLCIFEAKVTAAKSEHDKYVADCQKQKMELDEIEAALRTKTRELNLIMRNIEENGEQLLRLQDETSVEIEGEILSQEELISKKNSLLALSNEEILRKKQELLLVTAEVEKNEEIVNFYLAKIANSVNLIQIIYSFVEEKERSAEYLEKCRELQEQAFQRLSSEIDVKSKTIQELAIKINDMTITLSETENNVSEEERKLQDLIASEKTICQEIQSEERRMEELSQARERIRAEIEALQELLKKGREEENALQCKLVKLSEAIEDEEEEKECMKKGMSTVAKENHSGLIAEEALHLTSISSSAVPTTSLLLNTSQQKQYHPTQEDGMRPTESSASSLSSSLAASPCPRPYSYTEASSRGGAVMPVRKKSSWNLEMNGNLRSQSELSFAATRQNTDAMKKDQVVRPYQRNANENGERSVNLPYPSLDLVRYDTPFFSGIADGSQFMATAEGRSPPPTDTVTPTLRMIEEEAQLLRDASFSKSGGVYTPKTSQSDRLGFLPPHLQSYVQLQQKSLSENSTPLQHPHPNRISLHSAAPVRGMHSSFQVQSTASLNRSTPFSGSSGLDGMGSKVSHLPLSYYPQASQEVNREGEKNNGNPMETKEYEGEQNNYLCTESRNSNSASFPCDGLSPHGIPVLRNLSLVTTAESIRDGFNDRTSEETDAAGNIMSTLRSMRRTANVSQISNLTKKNLSRAEI